MGYTRSHHNRDCGYDYKRYQDNYVPRNGTKLIQERNLLLLCHNLVRNIHLLNQFDRHLRPRDESTPEILWTADHHQSSVREAPKSGGYMQYLTNPEVKSSGGVISCPFSSSAFAISIVAMIADAIRNIFMSANSLPGHNLLLNEGTPEVGDLKTETYRRPNPKTRFRGSSRSSFARSRSINLSGRNFLGSGYCCASWLMPLDRNQDGLRLGWTQQADIPDVWDYHRLSRYMITSILVIPHGTMGHGCIKSESHVMFSPLTRGLTKGNGNMPS